MERKLVGESSFNENEEEEVYEIQEEAYDEKSQFFYHACKRGFTFWRRRQKWAPKNWARQKRGSPFTIL